MQCRTHPGNPGVNTCNQCGEWLCDDCTIEVNGRYFCINCARQGTGTHRDPPGAPYRLGSPARISWGLLFMFSLLPPGINYMYEGLIKRGILTISAFFLLFYVSMMPYFGIFGFVVAILWIACVFDAFQIRRRINAGEKINDDINDILVIVKRNSKVIAGFLIVMAVLIASRTLINLSASFNGLPVIVILLGVYFLFKNKKSGGKPPKDNYNE